MTLLQSGLAKSLAEDYTIDQSLRFNDGDSAYLSRTISSTSDRKTYTISLWIKRGTWDGSTSQVIMASADSTGSDWDYLAWRNDNKFEYEARQSATTHFKLTTTQTFRDTGGWYHLVIKYDSTPATPGSSNCALFVNGSQVTAFDTETYPAQNITSAWNVASGYNYVGRYAPSSVSFLDGYIAEVHLIDGTALDADSFGETDSTTNQWKPKEYSGSYGTNGFYQKYASTVLADSFEDSSGNGSIIESFTSTGSDTWTCPEGVTEIEVLTVAGGGGGAGYYYAAGGGAGGIVHDADYTVVPGVVYDLTVGAGGAGGGGSYNGTTGSDSVFNVNAEGSGLALTAKGGGGGANGDSGNPSPQGTGLTGGSGGGAAAWPNNGAGGASIQGSFSGATSYGNAGGDTDYTGGSPDSNSGAGGGGGAGAVAGDASGASGGAGGAGQLFSTFTSYGVSGYFGGGGGGSSGSNSSVAIASGGSGGGGAGARYENTAAVAGTANTGGGGGGGCHTSGSAAYSLGKAGGSGVILIKYIGNHTITDVGDVANTRAESKVGDSSIVFDGTGDYLSVPDSSSWDFGTGEFTFEAWIRPDNATCSFMSHSYYETGENGNWAVVLNASNTYFYSYDGQGSLESVNATTGVSTGAWQHLAVERESDTVTIYLDGTSIGSGTITKSIGECSSAFLIGEAGGNAEFDGYMDEIRISDTARYSGAFTPSTTEFTTDSNTMLLIHSDWAGGLGADSSGNGNAFTVTNLVATDQMEDSPTNNFCTLNPLDISPVNSSTLSEGNLQHTGVSGGYYQGGAVGTIYTDKKIYYEVYVLDRNPGASSNSYAAFGFAPDDYHPSEIAVSCAVCSRPGEHSDGLMFLGSAGNLNLYQDDSTTRVSQTAIAAYEGSVVMMALDPESGKFWIGLNGTWQGSGDPGAGTNEFGTLVNIDHLFTAASLVYTDTDKQILNFGQDSSFAGNLTAQGNQDDNEIGDFYYDVPAGYLALCTSNLAAPEIADPTDHFNTVLYTGNSGVAQSITGVGFEPDAVWLKRRNYAGGNHCLFDQVRGANISQHVNSALADITRTDALDSFDSDGFSLGADTGTNVNYGAYTYVSWNWKVGGAPTVDNSAGAGATPTAGSVKIDGSNLGSALAGSIAATRLSANTTNGMSIVGYVGNATAGATIAHGLSQAPDLIAVKDRTSAYSWKVGSSSMNPTSPWNYWMQLDDSEARSDGSADIWNDTAPSASIFTIGDHVTINNDTDNFIAYCFHSVEGYSAVGSYVGNGDADGVFVYTGFKPAWVMIKRYDAAGQDWRIQNTACDPYNVMSEHLRANTNGAETTSGDDFGDYLSNGFKARTTSGGWNASGGDYLYIAFAETPFKTSNAR